MTILEIGAFINSGMELKTGKLMESAEGEIKKRILMHTAGIFKVLKRKFENDNTDYVCRQIM